MRALGRLVAIVHEHLAARSGLSESLLLQVRFHGQLLPDEAPPPIALVGLQANVAVQGVILNIVLIERVAVDVELDVLHDALAGKVAVAEHILVGRGSSGSVCLFVVLDVQGHVIEEVSELRNRESHFSSESGPAAIGLHLLIFVSDGAEWLEMSVHEQHVGTLNIKQRWGCIRLARIAAFALNSLQALAQDIRCHKHTVLFTIICNECENTRCCHWGVKATPTKLYLPQTIMTAK